MRLSRRAFIQSSAATCLATGALAACAPKPPTDAKAAGRTASSDDTAPIGFDSYLQQQGYTQSPSAPLITGSVFNGGLRYDDDLSLYGGTTYVKQQVARVEDARNKSTPGTLPTFTLIGVDTSTPAQARAVTELVLGYLTGVAGLDPARMRVTTTSKSSEFLPLLAKRGIASSQVRLRSWDEAVRDGSGSGCFAPAGHPANKVAPSFSLEYVMPDGSELEIAEISHDDPSGHSSGGIGVERVEMARTGRAQSWNSNLASLMRALQDESKRTGAAIPPGAAAIMGPAAG